ncbi:MAG TPA: hypothetical protein P5274_03200 [Candidatus Paceibacterota bacterium]|nr:hypothetical protein [Candidatus Paceibacterota bacterium]
MDPETKELIKEDLRLSQENNAMLNKLIWGQRISRWFGVIKWVVIIGSTVGALYYLEPLIGDLWGTYQELLGTVSDISVSSLPNR